MASVLNSRGVSLPPSKCIDFFLGFGSALQRQLPHKPLTTADEELDLDNLSVDHQRSEVWIVTTADEELDHLDDLSVDHQQSEVWMVTTADEELDHLDDLSVDHQQSEVWIV